MPYIPEVTNCALSFGVTAGVREDPSCFIEMIITITPAHNKIILRVSIKIDLLKCENGANTNIKKNITPCIATYLSAYFNNVTIL